MLLVNLIITEFTRFRIFKSLNLLLSIKRLGWSSSGRTVVKVLNYKC